MPKPNSIRCVKFSDENFLELFRDSLRIETSENYVLPEQAKYLNEYLKDNSIGCKTLIFERYYVDRHYMAEYELYYARRLAAPSNYCSRIHAFNVEITEEQLNKALTARNPTEVALLKSNYLGFIVVRPLYQTPIGRTLLKPFPEDSQNTRSHREFKPRIVRDVHLANLTLRVEGIPFQQQDNRVGACATTAIWSSLYRVTPSDGGRSPTPAQITESAVRYYLPSGRAYPSGGLRIEQMCEAMRSLGASPEVNRIHDPVNGRHILRCYLRSGIPPILALVPLKTKHHQGPKLVIDSEFPAHAVTVVGLREILNASPVGNVVGAAVSYDRIYVHDDRIGPYARVTIRGEDWHHDIEGKKNGLTYKRENEKRAWLVWALIVPLYPKIRSSVVELLKTGAYMRSLAIQLGVSGSSTCYDAHLSLSGDYLAKLINNHGSLFSEDEISTFMRSIFLSRYIGVVEIYDGANRLFDMLIDTTDRANHEPNSFAYSLLGCVCYNRSIRPKLIAELHGIPTL